MKTSNFYGSPVEPGFKPQTSHINSELSDRGDYQLLRGLFPFPRIPPEISGSKVGLLCPTMLSSGLMGDSESLNRSKQISGSGLT